MMDKGDELAKYKIVARHGRIQRGRMEHIYQTDRWKMIRKFWSCCGLWIVTWYKDELAKNNVASPFDTIYWGRMKHTIYQTDREMETVRKCWSCNGKRIAIWYRDQLAKISVVAPYSQSHSPEQDGVQWWQTYRQMENVRKFLSCNGIAGC